MEVEEPGVSDLVELSEVSSETVIGNLCVRFRAQTIYTNVGGGRVLLAMNPFRKISDYRVEGACSFRSPHIFDVARRALEGARGGRSQTIVISGESGAGKTEATKHVLRYLLGSDTNFVLETNPLLEAFGNARSLRNDNSSRFGKHVELVYDRKSQQGSEFQDARVRIETYLLEKVRVCMQTEGERNFHIFYQACAAASVGRRGRFSYVSRVTGRRSEISLKGFSDLSEFFYLTRSSVGQVEGVDDLRDFEKTLHALEVLGLGTGETEKIFGWLAAVLNLGNVEFVEAENSGGARVSERSRKFLALVGEQLGGLGGELLEQAMSRKFLSVGNGGTENFQAQLSPEKASENRDAFARHLYLEIFNFVVRKCNDERPPWTKVATISVYDIFGFEKFPVNGFEQLCINFANERLQKIFTDCVIGNEQKIMASEGLVFEPVEFADNQHVLDLLEKPGCGIFPLLDEEARIVGGSDGNFLARLVKTHGNSKNFQAIRQRKHQFQVQHFAGPVTYSVENFVEKNKDKISGDLLALLPRDLVSRASLAREASDATLTGRAKQAGTSTVSGDFRSQLTRLVEEIQETEPHFVRCVKPNSRNLPNIFDQQVVHDQLVYGGVLHALRLARTGFPVRVARPEFLANYGCLLPARLRQEPRLLELVETALARGERREPRRKAAHAVGRTRIFMKQEFFDEISDLLRRRENQAASALQAAWRGIVVRLKIFAPLKRRAVAAQALVRVAAARKASERRRATLQLQSFWRMARVRRKFKDEIKWRAKESSFRLRTPMKVNATPISEFARAALRINSRASLAPELNVPQMVGAFRQTQEAFAMELGRAETAALSQDDIARKMRDFQSELENAKQALNSVEEKISSSSSRQTLVVGAFRRTLAPAFNGGLLEANSPAANFSRRVVAFSAQARAQAESFRAQPDRVAHEEAEMKRLLGRIHNELSKTPATPVSRKL